MKISLIKSTFYNEIETKESLCKFIMNTPFLSMGSECKKFEESFSKFQERKHSIFVTSGSSANLLLIRALLNIGKLKVGQRVGVSSLTWSTNVMPIIEMGLVPILIDCEIDTLNVSLGKLKEEKIDALFLTNVLGFCSDIEDIRKHCHENNILFFEDNCESLGSKHSNGRLLGNFGIASTFSFFVGHHLPTLEGGMVCTDDDELGEALIIARAHGWSRNLPEDRQNKIAEEHNIDQFYNRYSFYDLSYNVRPNEITGFIGNVQIKYIDEILKNRETNFMRFYSSSLKNSDIIPLDISNLSFVSNFSFPMIFKTRELFLEYRKRFEKEDIEIRPIISGNIANQPFFKKYFKSNLSRESNAEFIHKNGFYFGNNPEMTREEVDFLCKLVEGREEGEDFSYYIPLEDPIIKKIKP